MKRGILENYKITEKGFDITVKITGGAGMITKYELVHREIPVATNALLNEVKQELITRIKISGEEILDPKVVNQLKEKFKVEASTLLDQKLPKLDKRVKNFLISSLLKDMLGLGDIEILLADPDLEEIIILSAKEPVRIFHKKYGWLQTNVFFPNENKIKDLFNIIARRVGRQITTLSPLLDAHLVSGDRANAVLYPISTKGNTLTIRKFARDPWTVTSYIKNNTCSADVFALIWFAMQYESNILVSGGTASGKTSLLNVMMPFISPNHRIISIEDTRELMLPEYLYWTPLTVRQPNPEGKGEVTMLDLLINSLRMRPDRIILGEMRRKDQAEVLFEAMHTGHSVYATVHADSVISTVQRLTNAPIEVPPNLLGAVNLNIVMFRNRRKNIRRIYQIGEFLTSEEEGIRPNIIYRWNPTTDQIVQHQKPIRLYEELSRHTGLTESEINEDIAKKEKILNWMVKHDIHKIEEVGKIMHAYYLNPEDLYKLVQKNSDPQKIITQDFD